MGQGYLDIRMHAVAEGKYADDGSGGGNGLAYGILAAISLGTAGILAVAPHTVTFQLMSYIYVI